MRRSFPRPVTADVELEQRTFPCVRQDGRMEQPQPLLRVHEQRRIAVGITGRVGEHEAGAKRRAWCGARCGWSAEWGGKGNHECPRATPHNPHSPSHAPRPIATALCTLISIRLSRRAGAAGGGG